MKKTKMIIAALAVSTISSQAAITLSFTNAANSLTNFLNGSGVANTALVWGIVVDTAGNGFQGASTSTPYDEGFSLNASANPLSLTVSNGLASDDKLYIASGFMATNTAIDGATGNVNRVLSMASMNITAPVAFGQSYAIIWFDSTARVVTTEAMKYGIFVPSATNVGLVNTTTADKLPGADGTYAYAPIFAGVEAAKEMGFTLGVAIPETSTTLLGAIGALAMLRRRR